MEILAILFQYLALEIFYDRLQDGTGELPDGTPIAALMPLKDRKLPPKTDKMHPGYPNFIEGKFGESPLQPPLGVQLPGGGVTNNRMTAIYKLTDSSYNETVCICEFYRKKGIIFEEFIHSRETKRSERICEGS